MSVVYDKVMEYKNKYSGTIAWRLKKHCKVIEDYINPDEEVLYAFCGQKNDCWYDITTSCVVVLTNKRLLIGQKRVVWGSFFTQITPDLYNDMKIYNGLFFGKIIIDSVKEVVTLSNLSKSSLDEIETNLALYKFKYEMAVAEKSIKEEGTISADELEAELGIV